MAGRVPSSIEWGAPLLSDYVFQYDAVGRNTLLTYPGGLQRSQFYDHQGRLTERCYSHLNGPNRCYRASYDAVGNPTSLQDPEDTDTITYDNLDRLSGIQRGNVTQTFSYNALGALHDNGGTILDDQRPKLAGGGNAASAVPATYNNLPITRDAGGFITQLNGVTLLYSQRGELLGATKVSGSTTLGEWYGHDGEGRRISRTVSSTTNNVTTFPDEEYFAWTGANVTGRVDKNGAVTQSFLFEGVDRPLRLRAGLLKYYYELDIAGNVRRLRRPDGTDAGGYRYAGFGGELANNVPPAIDQPLRWKARWWSDHSRLYDVRARQWSPDIGSFTSIDEFVFHEKNTTLWGWPNQTPARFSDPSGHCVAIVDCFIEAAVIGTALMAAMTVQGHDGALTPPGAGPDAMMELGTHLVQPVESEAAAELGLAVLRTRLAREFIGSFRAVVLGDMSAYETTCPPTSDLPPWNGPADYSEIPNPRNVGASTKPTPRQVAAMKAANRAQNGGFLRSDLSGDLLVDSMKSRSGITPPMNEVQVDHKIPVAAGGTRSQDNLQLLSRQENRDKWDN